MKKIAIAVVVIGLIVFAVIAGKKNKKVINWQETTPERGAIALEFRVTGSVEPRNQLDIKPQVSGRIENILVVEGQRVKKGEVIVWMSSTDRAALLDAVRPKGDEEVKKWEDVYNPTPIVAPITGFIIARLKEPGQSVGLSDIILVMADELIIEANIDETDLRYINLGQKAKIFLDAYPDKEFSGIIEHIAYKSEVINNVTVYLVKILPGRIPGAFRAGMTATVEVVADKKENVLILPVDAIAEKGGKNTVKVKAATGPPEIREITTGINNGKRVEITSGISAEDVIIMPELAKKESRSTQTRGFGMPGMGGGRH